MAQRLLRIIVPGSDIEALRSVLADAGAEVVTERPTLPGPGSPGGEVPKRVPTTLGDVALLPPLVAFGLLVGAGHYALAGLVLVIGRVRGDW